MSHRLPIRCATLACLLTLAAGQLPRGHAEEPGVPDRREQTERIRRAVVRSLPLLEAGARGSAKERSQCFTCHNQGLPILALVTARDHGFAITDELLEQQVTFIHGFLEKNRTRFQEGRGTGGQVATAGYALWALEAGSWKPDPTTAAVSEYLLRYQQEKAHWEMTSHRPPTEHSHFTANYLAIRGLQRFATSDQQPRVQERIAQAREWLLKTEPQETEDQVFRLWGLKLAEAPAAAVEQAAAALRESQRTDGGWSQTTDLESDAYATGTALAVLHWAGGLAPEHPDYQRGLTRLLEQQLEDGSWHVGSRSKPFQTYFESGYPHGKDQFISISAASWATIALALASDQKTTPSEPPGTSDPRPITPPDP